MHDTTFFLFSLLSKNSLLFKGLANGLLLFGRDIFRLSVLGDLGCMPSLATIVVTIRGNK